MNPAGTDDELASRLSNFDNHIAEQKRKRRTEEAQQQDLEEELTTARKTHSDQMGERGTLQAQLQVRRVRLIAALKSDSLSIGAAAAALG